MKIAFFDTHPFDREAFDSENQKTQQEIVYFEPRLTEQTAELATGFPCVCAFVNDRLNATVMESLAKGGTQLIALRSAGYNHVDLEKAAELGIRVVRVPEYSPYAVAEHTVALILTLNRKIHRAHARVREGNFSLDGLVGFDLHGKALGIVGTGKIGSALARIMLGFGCRVLAFGRHERSDAHQHRTRRIDRYSRIDWSTEERRDRIGRTGRLRGRRGGLLQGSFRPGSSG